MITFNIQNERRIKDFNLVIALINVELTFKRLEKDIDQLPIVTFDPLYTKPVNTTSIDIMHEALYENDIVINVKLYTQGWLAYKAFPVNAHVKIEEPDTIYFNTRMFTWGKSVREWMETILHESIHCMDSHSIREFNHGSNSLKGKDNAAPIKLARVLNSLDFRTDVVSAEHGALYV